MHGLQVIEKDYSLNRLLIRDLIEWLRSPNDNNVYNVNNDGNINYNNVNNNNGVVRLALVQIKYKPETYPKVRYVRA